MPQINILNILQGDNQSAIVDKINYNFDQILSAGGGPQGARGLVGPTGPLGPQGSQGPQGLQGPSGSKWFVQETSPTGGGITGSNPWEYPTLGDYWIDPDSANQSIYVFTATGWVDTGYGLGVGSLFQKVTPININGGGTAQAIMFAGATASNQTLVLSDSSISTYTPGGSPINNLNFENSKLKIATKDARTKLISFGRSDFDNTPGGSGGLSSGNNPYFSWDFSFNPSGASGAGPGFYGISFVNPKGSIGIRSLPTDPAEGGINLSSSNEITAQASDSISLITQSPNKGTFLGSSSIGQGGFFEFSNQPTSSPSNQSNAYMFANSYGLGLGLGTGQFKQTGEDSRRLAVLGNASISKSLVDQTTSVFVGHSSSGNYNKGALYVAGQGAFGSTGPTLSYYTDNFGAIQTSSTTGGSESLNKFPQFWITSADRGPALQIKTLGTSTPKGGIVLPRTIIGDGANDYDLESVSPTLRVSGIYSDITQTAQISAASSGFEPIAAGPVLSYQHKLAGTGTTSSNQPVFGVTTHVKGGQYSESNYASKTVIQTLNSNPNLIIQANSTGQATSNEVSIGTRRNNSIKVYASTGGAADYATVTVGGNADNFMGNRGSLSGSANFPQVTYQYETTSGSHSIRSPYDNHSLSVPGIVTIGTDDQRSAFNRMGLNQGSSFGGSSMLKINRNLFSSVVTEDVFIPGYDEYGGGYAPGPFLGFDDNGDAIFGPPPSPTSGEGFGGVNSLASGSVFNNYPNGLEITSYRGTGSSFTSSNRSVAIAVGASNQIVEYNVFSDSSYETDVNASGFFVSDTGENVSIGQNIDYNAALGVSGAGTDFAIKAYGNVSVTGTFSVSSSASIGNGLNVLSGGINATGSVTIRNGQLTLFGTSASSNFVFNTAGTVTNLSGSLSPSFGTAVSTSKNTDVIRSGKSIYASNGTVYANWIRIGNTVFVQAEFVRNAASSVMEVPLKCTAGIDNVVGHGIDNTTSATVEVKKFGTNTIELYKSFNPGLGNPIASNGTARITFSYVIT
jgi:hypothetical protein